jgi:hypothetical protein
MIADRRLLIGKMDALGRQSQKISNPTSAISNPSPGLMIADRRLLIGKMDARGRQSQKISNPTSAISNSPPFLSFF